MSRKLKVLSVVGTRPEAIKMAPVIKALAKHPISIRSVVVSTGQHRQMLNQVLQLFSIRPEVELDLMQPNQSLSGLTGSLFEGLGRVVTDVKPDWVLAQGDTTSVLVAALVSFYHHVKFGHVEAGLRSGDKWRPFPEEVNRRVADMVADAYFAPTRRSGELLLQEGCDPAAVYVTGNTVIDALMDVATRPFDWASSSLFALPPDARLVLLTAHRRESFGEPFRKVCLAVRDLARHFHRDGVHFVYPVHLNPNVHSPVGEILAGLQNVSLIKPLDYLSMVQVMKRSELILTDSGGIQEEAPTFGVPVLVMRETTERPEGVDAGMVRLVGTERENIVREASRLLADATARAKWPKGPNPYGDGKAAERIVSVLLDLGGNKKRSPFVPCS